MPLTARVAHAGAIVLLSVTLGFVALHLVPGDPLQLMVEQLGRSEASRAMLRRSYGLDAPLGEQLLRFCMRAVRGDFGVSITNGAPVSGMLRAAALNSAVLGILSLLVALAVGVSVGTVHGWWSRVPAARVLGTSLTALYAIPEFILALSMLTVFAFHARWFPVGGMVDARLAYGGSWLATAGSVLHHALLPALTLGLGWGAGIARQQRQAIHTAASEPFLQTARAKGVSGVRVLMRHALRVTLAPLATTVGLMVPALFSGAVLVEVLFSWPGIGSLLVQAVSARDYPVASGAMTVIGLVVAGATLGTDALRWWLDPRLRVQASAP